MTGKLFVGCAIWAYDGWVGNFYPAATAKEDRLRAYAARLNTVEVNSTFYAIPNLSTFQKWAAETPETFQFCPKFPKSITHTALLHDTKPQTSAFLGVARALGPRLGPLMLQLSPSFGPSRIGALGSYLNALPSDLEITVEVRHADWFKPKGVELLERVLAEHGAGKVLFDSRPVYASSAPEAIGALEKKPNVPLIAEANQPFVLIRYISSPILEENTPYLQDWSSRIATWLGQDRRVYFFAHCPVEELSPNIARLLYHKVAAQFELPPLAWDTLESTPPTALAQLTLF
ncbi:MAG: DUF72 domain-containing protein [Anaerolineae bacterium]